MTYTAIAIDDERFALDDLELVINRVPNLELKKTFQTGDEALDYVHIHGPVDAIFCDLDLKATGNPDDLEGIRLAEELKAWCALFYFFTGHPEYRIAAIDTATAGHLLKPVDPEKIKEGLAWLTRLRNQKKEIPSQLLVRDVKSGELAFVDIAAICCLCTHPAEKNHLEVVRKDGSEIIVYGSLKALYQRVKYSGRFIQLSQSAVVAKDAIVSENEGLAKVLSGHYFPISGRHKGAFRLYLSQLG